MSQELSATLSDNLQSLLGHLLAQIQEETQLLRHHHEVATESGDTEQADKADSTYRALEALTEAAEATLRTGL
jgi:hypothetical protein